ncbi:hypothetical protein FISHEDRAFT_55112 [Fistulina hepatica ATCC 64428]|uniref:Uncharacterized protein n=1 Tax=Fistulina hepatica ATCC 64428 TaxID=1128425 RepID=A0A0D7AQC4_9AGAR|nr:hypothetical protein FISHEDRAFT_55112 [Fistulina hepatica ATCC 64428]
MPSSVYIAREDADDDGKYHWKILVGSSEADIIWFDVVWSDKKSEGMKVRGNKRFIEEKSRGFIEAHFIGTLLKEDERRMQAIIYEETYRPQFTVEDHKAGRNCQTWAKEVVLRLSHEGFLLSDANSRAAALRIQASGKAARDPPMSTMNAPCQASSDCLPRVLIRHEGWCLSEHWLALPVGGVRTRRALQFVNLLDLLSYELTRDVDSRCNDYAGGRPLTHQFLFSLPADADIYAVTVSAVPRITIDGVPLLYGLYGNNVTSVLNC